MNQKSHAKLRKSLAVFTVFVVFVLVKTVTVSAQVPELEIFIGSLAYDVEWSPDGQLIAVALASGIKIYDSSLEEVAYLQEHTGGVTSVAWNSDNTQLASTSATPDGSIEIWNRDTGSNSFDLDTTLQSDFASQFRATWSPDGSFLATIGVDTNLQYQADIGTVQLWDTETWQLARDLNNLYANPSNALAWSPDSSELAGGGVDLPCMGCAPLNHVAFIADVTTGERIHSIELIESPLSIEWLTTNALIIGMIDVWEYNLITIQPARSWHSSPYRMDWNNNGTKFVSGRIDGTVEVIDAPTGVTLLSIETASNLYDLDWRSDELLLATITNEGILQIWDTSNLPNAAGTPTITPLLTLTPTVTPSHTPSFTPTPAPVNKLAFSMETSANDFRPQIFTLNLDGTNLTQLPGNPT